MRRDIVQIVKQSLDEDSIIPLRWLEPDDERRSL
jgi:hypothetical protein